MAFLIRNWISAGGVFYLWFGSTGEELFVLSLCRLVSRINRKTRRFELSAPKGNVYWYEEAGANAEKLLRNQNKAIERSRKQATAAEEAKKYADRQAEAQKRRADHEAEKAKQAKPPAKSLPVPEL